MKRGGKRTTTAKWVAMAKLRQRAIFQDSAARVGREASVPVSKGGKMPLDTGFLRASLCASTSGMPSAGGVPLEVALLSLDVGGTVYAGWTAVYAMRMEYGFSGEDSLGRTYRQQGYGFLRASVQRWPEYVADAAARANRMIK